MPSDDKKTGVRGGPALTYYCVKSLEILFILLSLKDTFNMFHINKITGMSLACKTYKSLLI